MGGGAGDDEEGINAIDVRGGREKQANAEASATLEAHLRTSHEFSCHPLQNCAMHRTMVA
jgi:hypothetical protein